MSNDLKSIHDFDFTMICNYFKLLERQGPGSPEVTQKAVSFINELSDEANRRYWLRYRRTDNGIS